MRLNVHSDSESCRMFAPEKRTPDCRRQKTLEDFKRYPDAS
jgi:hypothetical protein